QVDAHALLAAVVDAEVHALTADERRMLACLLTTRPLDLYHFGPEVAEDHPTTRAGLKTRELQHPDAVEREAHRELRPSPPGCPADTGRQCISQPPSLPFPPAPARSACSFRGTLSSRWRDVCKSLRREFRRSGLDA